MKFSFSSSLLKRKRLQKFFSWLSIFSLLLQLNANVLLVTSAIAQEATPAPNEGPNLRPEVGPAEEVVAQPAGEVVDPVVESPAQEPTPAEVPVEPSPELVEPTPTEVLPIPTLKITPTAIPPADPASGPSIVIEEEVLAIPDDQAIQPESLDLAPSEIGGASAQLNPAVFTDKQDYHPSESVTITGNDLQPDSEYLLVITSPDDPAFKFESKITSSPEGLFSYVYQLDGTSRPNYKVELKDASDQVVASTTFTDPAPIVIINEFASKDNPKWIELHNTSDLDVFLSGWKVILDSDESLLQELVFIPADFIPANGYKAIDRNPPAWLNNGGDTITLKDASGVVVDTVSYGDESGSVIENPGNNESAQRCPNGNGEWVITSNSSKGAPNACGISAGCVTPPAGMISWWPGDGNTEDIVSNNNGSLQNGAIFASGKVDQAFSFDGADDYLSIPDGIISSTARNFTVDAWVYAESFSGQDLIVYSGPSGGGEYYLARDDDGLFNFAVYLSGSGWQRIGFPADTGVWRHLTGVRRGTVIEIWIDGVLKNSMSIPDEDLVTARDVHSSISSYNRGQYGSWDGLIDEVEIFNRALSQEEIAAIYNADSAGKCKDNEPEPVDCGNGQVEGREKCDDGNRTDDDYCNNSCEINHVKVDICHATPPDSAAEGWNTHPEVDDDSIVKESGHDGHGADIIPAFDYYEGHYPGKNLATLFNGFTGQEILDNRCVIPNLSPTPTPTPVDEPPLVCEIGTLFMIGDAEASQLDNPVDELNWTGVFGVFPTFPDPFNIGSHVSNEFPWNSNFSQGYATDFDIDFTSPEVVEAKLTISWGPGRSANEQKEVFLDGVSLGKSPIRLGSPVAGWWEQMALFEDTYTFPLSEGDHSLNLRHLMGDGTLWDYVKLEIIDCGEPEKPEYLCGSTVYGINNNAGHSWINPVTGEVHEYSQANFGSSASADHPQMDRTYYIERADDGTDRLAYYDHALEADVPVGSLGVASFFTKLAFRGDGALFGLTDTHALYRINYTLPLADFLGVVTGIGSGGDIVFDDSGMLYLIGTNGDFYSVNVNTLAKTKIADTGIPYVSGLAFAAGQFYVATRGADGTSSDIYFMDYLGNETPLAEDQTLVNDLSSCPIAPSTGSITVYKNTSDVQTSEEFTVELGGDATDSTSLTAGGEGYTFGDLVAGTYTLTETNIPEGWELDRIVCDDILYENGLQLAADQDIKCTVFNKLTPFCGDGVKNGEEECDGRDLGDVNSDNYFCTPTCQLIPLYDGDHVCPSGTVKSAEPVASYDISSTNPDGQSFTLGAGDYLFQASGTFVPTCYNQSCNPNWYSDAGYTTGDAWTGTLSDYGIQGSGENYAAHALLADLGSGVGVVDWGNYNSDHLYTKYWSHAGGSLQFLIGDRYGDWFDTSWQDQSGMNDNSGSLTLDIYECQVTPVKIIAQKIVCDSESDLPDWHNSSNITEAKINTFLSTHPNCHVESGWDFQWGFADKAGTQGVDKLTGTHLGLADGTSSAELCSAPYCGPNTQTGSAYNQWKTFGPTDENGLVEVSINDLEGAPGIWVRESLKENYLPFTYPPESSPGSNVSAEIWCHADVANYDNFDQIASPQLGQTYYCVAFNTPAVSEVKVCKKDESGAPLAGWHVQLLGDKVEGPITVLPNRVEVFSSDLAFGDYALVASGLYKYRNGNPTGDGFYYTDPNYSERAESDALSHSDSWPWFNVNDFPAPHTGWLGIMVNGSPTDWSSYYNPGHNYALGYFGYTGSFGFKILDDQYGDNTGSLAVDIYKGYAGTTGDDGCATFSGVPFGQYTVGETLKQNWGNVSGLETVTVDESNEQFDVVNRQTFGSFAGKKYIDYNGDGQFVSDDGDILYAGLTIKLDKHNGTDYEFLAETTTDSNGEYLFTNLEAGMYRISEVAGDDYRPTDPNELGLYDAVNLAAGENLTGFDFGNFEKGDLYVDKYEDTDGMLGRTEGQEYLIGDPTFTFRLYKVTDSGWVLAGTADTDFEGRASFVDVFDETGEYFVCEVKKDGWQDMRSLNNPANNQSGADDEYPVCDGITVPGSDYVVYAEFGNARLGSIHGVKWEDSDGDGRRDCLGCPFESLLPGWEIFIDSNKNGAWDTGEPKTITSGEVPHFGWYWFDNLMPGEYQVCEVLKPGWMQTYPAGNQCHTVTLPDSNPFNLPVLPNAVVDPSPSYDFGNYQLGLIQGRKYEDLNLNGTWEAGELWLKDWDIRLYDADWNLFADGGSDTETTNNQGLYRFKNLPLGTYYTCEVLQDGWTQTGPVLGSQRVANQSGASDEGPVCWRSVFNQYGQKMTGRQFGNTQSGGLTVCKYDDEDGDGELGDNEPVMPDVTMILEQPTGEPSISPTPTNPPAVFNLVGSVLAQVDQWEEVRRGETDENGCVTFADLPAGSYRVLEDLTDPDLIGYSPTDDGDDTPDGVHEVDLVAGQTQTVNFLNHRSSVNCRLDKFRTSGTNVPPGSVVSWAITFFNDGPATSFASRIKEMLPAGFTYRPESTDGDAAGEPTENDGELIWDMGDIPGYGSRTVYFDTDTDSSLAAFNYPGPAVAWGYNRPEDGEITYTNFDVAWVQLVKDPTTSTTIESRTEQVLGASTEAEGQVLGAATGADTRWLVAALLMIASGLAILLRKKLKKLLGLLALVFVFALAPQAGAVDSLFVALSELPGSVRSTDLSLSYSVIEREGQPVTVRCYLEKDGGFAWRQFDDTKSASSGFCRTDGSDFAGEGTYRFKAVASSPGGDTESNQTSTVLDLVGLGAPRDYWKARENATTYKIHWRTPMDSDFAFVRIYTSEDRDFTANDDSKREDVASSPDQEFEKTLGGFPADKEIYFALQAFDKAGNPSGIVGDGPSVVTEYLEGETGAGEEIVAGGEFGEVAGTSGQVLGGESAAGDEIDGGESTEAAATDATQAGLIDRVAESIKTHRTRWFWLLGALAVGGAGYFFLFRKQSK